MREKMRSLCHDIWILDLGGEGRGSRREKNVFNIQTPVTIAIAARYGVKDAAIPANVHYTRIWGNRNEKLTALRQIENFDSLSWNMCPTGFQSKFIPQGEGEYFSFPLLTDIFPWQHSGVQFKRKWPIAHDSDILEVRWRALLSSANLAATFKETRDRKVGREYPHHLADRTLASLSMTHPNTRSPEIVRYGYRSFDQQWCLMDNRLGDYLRPPISLSHSERQLYFASIFTQLLGNGPALTLSAAIPDLDYFSGRGAKNIVPLYRDAAAAQPNILPGLLQLLVVEYGCPVTVEDFAAYAYAMLAHSGFTERFHEELTNKEIRLPLTKNPAMFAHAVNIGRRLIWLHSYGERMIPEGCRRGEIPSGAARCVRAVPGAPEAYPEDFSYNEATRTLYVGAGEFAPVNLETFQFEVSGLKVVQSWLKYRMKQGAGRTSSPLDDIRPERWTAECTTELIKLLWILEATIAGYPEQEDLLDDILAGPIFLADELPEVPDEARKPPERAPTRGQTQANLLSSQ
jgi:hypothetical protein